MKTGLAYSEVFLEHDTGLGHPENKNRLIAILNKLKQKSYFSELINVPFEKASQEIISKVHTKEYINSIINLDGKKGYLDGDTPYSPKSCESAFYACGAGLSLAEKILSGKIENGLALVRPPGHHAEEEHAMGFCLFNNIAVTARYLQSKGVKKIFIIDWDVHHGNGTQNTFYEDPNVFFCSLHQFPFYPGSGSSLEIGTGEGKGFTLNIPLARGSGFAEYKQAFQEKIIPALEKFVPEFILISAGFDAHKRDPLAGMELPTQAYEEFTKILTAKAKELCGGKILSFLEGGYDLQALADSVEAHLAVLKG